MKSIRLIIWTESVNLLSMSYRCAEENLICDFNRHFVKDNKILRHIYFFAFISIIEMMITK